MKDSLRILSLVFVLALVPLSGGAQIWLSNEDIYDEAEEFLNAEEYVEALPLYLLLEKKEVMNANISYKIGECYLNIRGKKGRSIPYLEQAVADASSAYENSFSETKAPLESLLSLGIAYRVAGQLDKAEQTFNILRDSVSIDNLEMNAVIDVQLLQIKNARLLGAFPGEPRTERLPSRINNEHSNYNPVLVNHDSVLYYMEEMPFYDAIMRVRMENTEWGMPENLTPNIGSDGDHILVGSNAGGDELFLYFYQPMRMGEIYTTRNTPEGWSPLEPLNDNINTKYNETHASVSVDGRTLYFTSNRPGGFGGLDIYKSVREDSSDWGPAVNLGPVVNTSFDEENPIINSEDEILYFSSRGHLSMGGFDVFYSLKRDEETWRKPINMGSPVSTTDDDLFYFPLESTVSGLMSRLEEPDAWGYDIYRYNSMVFANSPRFVVRGRVEGADSTNHNEYTVSAIDDETGKTVYSTHPGPDGFYEMVLPSSAFTILVTGPDGSSQSNSLVIGEDSDEVLFVAAALPVSNDSSEAEVVPVVLPAIQVDTFYIEPILFGFDQASVPEISRKILGEWIDLLREYPELHLLIEGHTDNLGSESYNYQLSLKRAKAVGDYLEKHSVSEDRIEIRGQGENQPIARNSNPDGTDSPEGRRYNRRVVIIPVSDTQHVVFIQKEVVPTDLME